MVDMQLVVVVGADMQPEVMVGADMLLPEVEVGKQELHWSVALK